MRELSLELGNKPSRIETLRKAMKKEVSDYREAVADDEDYPEYEANEELESAFERRLFQEKFTLLHKSSGSPHENAREVKISIVLKTLKDIWDLENYLIEWDGVIVPAPSEHLILERFGDFTRYIANQYEIPYQI